MIDLTLLSLNKKSPRYLLVQLHRYTWDENFITATFLCFHNCTDKLDSHHDSAPNRRDTINEPANVICLGVLLELPSAPFDRSMVHFSTRGHHSWPERNSLKQLFANKSSFYYDSTMTQTSPPATSCIRKVAKKKMSSSRNPPKSISIICAVVTFFLMGRPKVLVCRDTEPVPVSITCVAIMAYASCSAVGRKETNKKNNHHQRSRDTCPSNTHLPFWSTDRGFRGVMQISPQTLSEMSYMFEIGLYV